DVRVERDVLLPGRRLDGGDHLSGDAQLRKGPEGGQLLGPEIPDRLVKANHTLLNDVLAIGPDEEVGTGFGPHEVAVLVDQVLEGRFLTLPRELDDFLVVQSLE